MKITWIEHSSFIIESDKTCLIFDYYGKEKLSLDPNKKTIFFATHHHHDHFDRAIFQHAQDNVKFVLSRDIIVPKQSPYLRMRAYEKAKIDEVEIETLRSTDLGVAFIVKMEGWTIYHAGDLNWWHWIGENEADNLRMKQRYFHELSQVQGRHFDLAFCPTDPRLETAYYWGLDEWMKHTDTDHVIPMHTFNENKIIDQLINQDQCLSYRCKIVDLRQGCVSIEKQEIK